MPKPRLSVSKQCEECGVANPVAIRSCNACGADFYMSSLDKSDGSPGEADGAPSTPGGSERRKSGRVKREAHYYDALDFDTKRRGDKFIAGGPLTPTRSKRSSLSDKIPYRSPKMARHDDSDTTPKRGRPRGPHGRATLTWKKGQEDDDYNIHDKRRKKKKHTKDTKDTKDRDSENTEESVMDAFEDLPPEKSLQCQVSLAEINRKLIGVMFRGSYVDL